MATFNTWSFNESKRTEPHVQLHKPIVNLKVTPSNDSKMVHKSLTKQQIVNRKRRAAPDYHTSLLMRLPTELHRMLFDYLQTEDMICLILTCKYFTRVGDWVNATAHSLPVGPQLLRINQGFSDRIPKRLRTCQKCGIMRPKDSGYWVPHRCGWNWRKLIPPKEYRNFAEGVNTWAIGRNPNCPRCFGTLVAQGNLDVAVHPVYGDFPRRPERGTAFSST